MEGWTYTIDKEAEKKAMDDLTSAEEKFKELMDAWNLAQQKLELEKQVEALESARDTNIKNIEDQIDKLKEFKDEWSKAMDVEEDITKYEGMVEALQAFEKGSYEQRKSMLNSFTTAWVGEYRRHEDSVTKLEGTIKSLETQLKALKTSADNATNSAKNSANAGNTAKTAFDNALSSMNAFDNAKKNQKTSVTAWDGDTLYLITTYGDGRVEKKRLGQMTGTGKNQEYHSASGGTILQQYAHGGVSRQFNGDELLDYTGLYNESRGMATWVDGSKNKPEVVVSNDSAVWLHDMLMRRQMPDYQMSETMNRTSYGDTITIDNINVSADSSDTVKTLLRDALNQSKLDR